MGRRASAREKIALLYDGDFSAAYERAEELRAQYDTAMFTKPKKLRAFLDRLSANGYAGFCFADSEIKRFGE